MNKTERTDKIAMTVILTISIALLIMILIPSYAEMFAPYQIDLSSVTPRTHTERTTNETAFENIITPINATEAYSEAAGTTERMIDLHNLSPEHIAAIPRGVIQDLSAEPEARYNLTDEEKIMVMFVSDYEDHTDIDSRQAVMQVIMNRTYHSGSFPDTITEVLHAPKQFQVMKLYSADYTPSDEAVEALERLLYGDSIFDGAIALYFARADVPASRIARGLTLIDKIGGSKFFEQN